MEEVARGMEVWVSPEAAVSWISGLALQTTVRGIHLALEVPKLWPGPQFENLCVTVCPVQTLLITLFKFYKIHCIHILDIEIWVLW